MADDIAPRGEHPGTTAARREILGESDRASRRAFADETKLRMQANRNYGGSRQELIDRGQREWNRAVTRNAVTMPEPPANASRTSTAINARPSAAAAAENAVGRAVASRALGAVGGGLGIAMTPTEPSSGFLPVNQRPRAGFRNAANQIGREVGRSERGLDGEGEAYLRDEYPLPARGNARAAPNPEDYAPTSGIVPGPTRPARRSRPTSNRPSDADLENEREMTRILNDRSRDRAKAGEDAMKKGGMVKMAKGGQVKGLKPKTMFKPKMAGGGSVRGCGIAQRGKTRGRVV